MTTFSPVVPTIRVPPTRIAADTWMIRSGQQALGQPLFIYLNSMVILGSEPMMVDTGTVANRTQWLQDVFSLVDPAAVRWIFLSHDDVDHTATSTKRSRPVRTQGWCATGRWWSVTPTASSSRTTGAGESWMARLSI